LYDAANSSDELRRRKGAGDDVSDTNGVAVDDLAKNV
jgi:hypothetical protein